MSMQKIAQHLRHAQSVLITSANGFSISEGPHLFARNQAFLDLFGDFAPQNGGVFYYRRDDDALVKSTR